MKAYIAKFNHRHEDGTVEEMHLCLHAPSLALARETYVAITGGEQNCNDLLSITTSNHIEYFWLPNAWKFVTVPQDEERNPTS